MKAVAVASAGALLLAVAMPAAATDWNGGSGDWNTAANWTPADVPDSGGEIAAILDAVADQTITGNATNIRHLEWTQTTDNVTSKLVLDRNFETNIAATTVSNTGTNSNVIVDLNGFRWKLNRTATNTINNIQGLRIEDSGGGGWLESDNIGLHATSSVGPGVEMRSGSGESRSFGSWDPTALIRGTQTRFDINFINGTGLGNVLMDVANQRNFLMENDTEGRVQGDWTITGAGAFIRFGGTGRNLIVNGNWTDTNSNDGLNYSNDAGGSTITFAGDPASPRTVTIGRDLLIDFAVGFQGEAGDIMLGGDLTTSGNTTVLGGSKVNVGLHTLTTGNLDLQDGSELEIGFGSNGQVVVNGTANLDGNLTLSGLGSITDEVILITSSNPLVGEFDNAPNGAMFGSLQLVYNHNGNNLALIPEPSVLGMLALCGVATLRRRRS
ncbi:MAG: hypothetical protein CMJ18_08110 [Phycisphaeraceae bacterium]|nr:hypothetical protein [Phycisphaeraceae bacterium]